ncbi:MAG: diaminopimelate decarboxylase, partial [Chloroflexota bacterium]
MTNPRLPLFPVTTEIKPTTIGEQLTIAGCTMTELADQFGTPLYIYDAATLDAAVLSYQQSLADFYPGESGITYAGKAFLSVAMAQWTQRQNLWVDCTGLGELRIAAAAGVPRKHTLLHGVNKSYQVLSTGIAQAGTIVVDNLTELNRLVELCSQVEAPCSSLWLRFRPGEAVETHTYITTGQKDSKFGMSEVEIMQAAHICRMNRLPFSGLHFHLGSQFSEPGPIEHALEKTLDLAEELGLESDWTLCIGGGWGVSYHEDELPHPSIADFVQYAAETVEDGCTQRGIPLPRLHLEPGRSLVARAGVALYRVGTVKRTPTRRWILVDGGLADNPRFALYQARYSALPVVDPTRPNVDAAWIAGPFCESGDVLIEQLPFPEVQPDELIAVPASGAYQLSMANNYNGATRPAAIWLEDGKASLIRARETPDDLIRKDKSLIDNIFPLVEFHKYHGLGNDYIVVSESDLPQPLDPEQVQRICDRHYGIGADGIVIDCSKPSMGNFAVQFYNPDGSQFDISGNGLRIFSRYLWGKGQVHSESFTIQTPAGEVEAKVEASGTRVNVMMGKASFDSHSIPVEGPHREVINETIQVDGQELNFCAVTLGNPHCVILRNEISSEYTKRWGPQIEIDPRFPNRTNVQFIKVLDRANIQIEIWERGVGYTLASGSSSCAAATVAHRLGLCDSEISVHMPGGEI